ncbi:hypothetical protein F0P96_19655 [Hymenobacter busanensis]|uniref:Uncharacterized protein n=1 Tax=Hymenobacter busanensis TaxID=2607656 RepID=A0A7L5A220_9BACT|nr:hypothetical protein [Hymenobacter busanensis]KAA9325549.1 hypothetical protein F0P96_19655 [Hymenobacter busanensis]QHJ07780.1 hypothetical protein GUY19_11010 [Hymenobacter busanensis]
MLALGRLVADDTLLRWSSRISAWMGDFDQVDMSIRWSYSQRPAEAQQFDRKLAIMCYLSIFGWLLAYRMPKEQRSTLVNFHLRQMTLLHIVTLACLFSQVAMLPVWGWSSLMMSGVCFGVIMLMRMFGVMAAMNSSQEPLPIIGRLAQRLLRDI